MEVRLFFFYSLLNGLVAPVPFLYIVWLIRKLSKRLPHRNISLVQIVFYEGVNDSSGSSLSCLLSLLSVKLLIILKMSGFGAVVKVILAVRALD